MHYLTTATLFLLVIAFGLGCVRWRNRLIDQHYWIMVIRKDKTSILHENPSSKAQLYFIDNCADHMNPCEILVKIVSKGGMLHTSVIDWRAIQLSRATSGYSSGCTDCGEPDGADFHEERGDI